MVVALRYAAKLLAGGDLMQPNQLKRRDLIALIGGAASCPFAAHAQQQPAMPVIGLLNSAPFDAYTDNLVGFRLGLKAAGFVEGENVSILYRSAEDQAERLRALAEDLVRRQVTVIAAVGERATFAAKAATMKIPVVFMVAEDPVRLGLVASLARPDGNLTGINIFASELAAKRFQLLRELLPAATRVGVLVDPSNKATAETTLREVEAAAQAMRIQLQVLHASNGREITAAFATLVRERAEALFVSIGTLFTSRKAQLATLAARYVVPMTTGNRQITEAGALMSYGANLLDAYRQMGLYCGRILKGATPADLPVMQASKFELVINAETARMLDVTLPSSILAIADEVIE
jgi:putative tryptophan/tyrosine transport system substrate-binding protein